MSHARDLVFLHGASGPEDTTTWLGPLNLRLAQMGHSRFDPAHDRLTSPDYLSALLRAEPGAEPARTWTQPNDQDHQQARLRYLQRQDELSRVGRAWERSGAGPVVSWVPDDLADDGWVTRIGIRFIHAARRYQRNRDARWAAQRSVLAQLPTSGPVILIAHSLGSVVAADLLTKLPPGLRIDLLLTIGSPLAIKRLGDPGLEGEFPYDRVGGWVNLYDPGDIVTVGCGVGRRFPAARDITVETGQSHDGAAYLSNPAAAAIIGHHAFGAPAVVRPASVQRRLHPAWQPLLLSFAYSNQLSSCARSQEWLFKARVDTARSLLARRTLADVHAKRQELYDDEALRLDDSPVAEGRFPTEDDLLHHPAELVHGIWTDDALLSLAVGLEMSPPLYPFDIKVTGQHRHDALLHTLRQVRTRHGEVSDREFADAVSDGVRAGQNAVRESGFPWGTVLISGGIVLLSLTGVGLAIAAPAGLAAAVVTGTLVAFGPGGLIGGLITIATLTGVGAAVTGIGVGVGGAEDPEVVEQARRLAVEELSTMPIGALRQAVAGVLAVVDTQRRLRFESTGGLVEEMLNSALDLVRAECELHEAVAPDRPGTRDWRRKVQLLERALEWLRGTHLRQDPRHRAQQDVADLPDAPHPQETPRPQLSGPPRLTPRAGKQHPGGPG